MFPVISLGPKQILRHFRQEAHQENTRQKRFFFKKPIISIQNLVEKYDYFFLRIYEMNNSRREAFNGHSENLVIVGVTFCTVNFPN